MLFTRICKYRDWFCLAQKNGCDEFPEGDSSQPLLYSDAEKYPLLFG